MKCPHCDYENGWAGIDLGVVVGKKGDFFVLNGHTMIQHYDRTNDVEKTAALCGCPSCKKTFID